MEAHGGTSRGKLRPKGSIETLGSGSLRVRVYSGIDELSRRKLYLTEVIPAGPDAQGMAEKVRDAFVKQVEEGRQPRTDASITQMLDRYLDEWDKSDAFHGTLLGYQRNHVNPLIGEIKARRFGPDEQDKFYRELKRCRAHCDGRPFIRHRTTKAHGCDHRCAPHECVGLGATTIRHIHFLLSGAYKRAKRWTWVTDNPMPDAEPPSAPPPAPKPPTVQQAASILNEAWLDEAWGVLVWVAMTTGARRGELCALRWSDIDFEPGEETIWIARAIKKGKKKRWVEGPTKTHQQRRVALDPETVLILCEFYQGIKALAEALGRELAEDAFIFSPAPDHCRYYSPNTLTQRYDRMVKRLKIHTSLHKLRHYSATQLIRAGVDPRTVAGRIGHGGGGTTTLKVYAAFVSEADQRAAGNFLTRMPQRPTSTVHDERVRTNPRYPYQRIASAVYEAWCKGEFASGAELTVNTLAETHGVSTGTAHRVTILLQRWGVVQVEAGKANTVLPAPEGTADDRSATNGTGQPVDGFGGSHTHAGPALESAQEDSTPITAANDNGMTSCAEDEPDVAQAARRPALVPGPGSAKQLEAPAPQLVVLDLIYLGTSVRKVTTEADPNNFAALKKQLLAAVRRIGGDLSQVEDYELAVHVPGRAEPVTTVVVAA